MQIKKGGGSGNPRSWLSLSISKRHAGPISTHISMRPPTTIRNYYILYITWCGGFIWSEFITRFQHRLEIIKMSQVNFTIKVELTHLNTRNEDWQQCNMSWPVPAAIPLTRPWKEEKSNRSMRKMCEMIRRMIRLRSRDWAKMSAGDGEETKINKI